MKTLITALAILLFASVSWAANTVEIQFTYDDQGVAEYEAAAFRIYIDGTELCATEDATVGPDGHLYHSCALDVSIIPGTHDFTMTAVYQDNTESPPSNMVQAVIPKPPVVIPDPLAPQIIQIDIQVE